MEFCYGLGHRKQCVDMRSVSGTRKHKDVRMGHFYSQVVVNVNDGPMFKKKKESFLKEHITSFISLIAHTLTQYPD